MIGRRGFIGGLIAAPLIVRAASLMPVKQMLWTPTRVVAVPGATYLCTSSGTLFGFENCTEPMFVKLDEPNGVPFRLDVSMVKRDYPLEVATGMEARLDIYGPPTLE